MNVIERFMQLLLEQEDESNLTPIVQNGDVAFVYVKHTNVYCRHCLVVVVIFKFVLIKSGRRFKSQHKCSACAFIFISNNQSESLSLRAC